ncbi:uncharacterized protein LOC125487247 isoform X2 [Rhincodon typus]|uniref:uncharacterized protein LOC125487247 isoform X2 n=1 Tax=Rhincodon typus TaxID=259920 RepID=UPI00202F34A2|nr:uncharacterized protein LOC125487247 isoform X2 [Rhincodon typus]
MWLEMFISLAWISEGWILIHNISLVTSVMALVSTLTSFVACCFIIFFALKFYKVHKQHMELTAVFMLFQMLSFSFLLIAAVFCIIDSVYPKSYRIIEGVGFFLISGTIVYIVYLYLQPENLLKRSFLVKKDHQRVFWIYGIFSVLISALPIYRGKENMLSWPKLRRLSTHSRRVPAF